ncbi:helix-turn-helix domain-containing protein [Cohnella sp. GCM10012308]|uniref:helix-turn-helix domain-containing protein n=1 Tax=Cohnella sp. GCM10012308 TaxID=3317329 RepID=UPI0036186757
MVNALLKRPRPRKYWIRLFWTVILLITLVLLVFASVLYAFIRHTAVALQQEANRKVLNQVVYNLDYLNETLQSLTLASYRDRNVITLLKSEKLDDFQLYNRLYALDALVNANRFLDSVWVYNASSGCTYSSTTALPVSCAASDGGVPAADPRNLIAGAIDSQQAMPMLKLLPIDSASPTSGSGLFAYMMYDSLSGYKPGHSLLMLAVRADWVLDNIKKINEAGGSRIGDVFVIDDRGRTYSPSGESVDPALVRPIVARLGETADRAGFFTVRAGGDKYFVTASRAEESGWTSVSVQRHSDVYGDIDRIARFTFLSLLGFVLLGALASGFVANRLYRPVDRLVRILPREGMGEDERDELKFAERAYLRMSARLSDLQSDRDQTRRLLDTYNIQRLLTESRALKREEAETLLADAGLKAVPSGADSARTQAGEPLYAVVVLKIDDHDSFLRARSEQERRLCLFAITNIAEEIIGDRFPSRAADMRSDHAAVLIRLGDDAAEEQESLWSSLLKPVQAAVLGYYALSMTAAVSDSFTDIRAASRYYDQASSRALRRLTLGKGAIITASAQATEDGPEPPGEFWKLPYELQKNLADAVRSGDRHGLTEGLRSVRTRYADLPPQMLDHAVLRLLALVDQALYERPGGRPPSLSLNAYLRDALEQETLDDLFGLLGRLAEEIAEESDESRGGRKNRYLIDMIKDMTRLHYKDPGYSLQAVADAMKMSAAYLGRCFREQEGISVADWIVEVRLSHAIDLLERTDDSVSDIMRETGFVSESTFFKWFKKKTGMTPKDYRLHALKQANR